MWYRYSDGNDISAQQKLSKSSNKVKHPKVLCTLILFANFLFMYANQCLIHIMVTISPCDDEDDMLYILERSVCPHYHKNKKKIRRKNSVMLMVCFLQRKNILYNPSTGDCELLYVDLPDDPCNLYAGDTGTGSIGLKARINVNVLQLTMIVILAKKERRSLYY